MEFGFLINDYVVSFDGIKIGPLPSYAELIQEVYQNWEVAGGWIYPPKKGVPEKQTFFEQRDFEQPGPILENNFFILPSTHSILDERGVYDDERLKFLIMGYGFLLGRYLLPKKYLYFCKIPHDHGVLHSLVAKLIDCEVGLQIINKFYSDSTQKDRKQMFAIMHWFLLSGSYNMIWDYIDAQYKVLDGIYRLSVSKGLVAESKTHAERPVNLSKAFNIVPPKWVEIIPGKKVSELSQIRNELVHEAKFCGEPIGYNLPKINFRLQFPNFNIKLICKLLGLQTEYTEVPPYDSQMHLWQLNP